MSENEQIDEMALIIGDSEIYEHEDYLEARQKAKEIYNKGYHKQSDGNWIIKKGGYYQRLVCSVCEKLSIATFDYCPNCGAKMKGKNL